jgi:hypothetical protein
MLLLSNSGRPYLAHARTELQHFLGPARRLGFISAASLGDEAAYYETARSALAPEIAVEHLRWDRTLPSRAWRRCSSAAATRTCS